MEILVGVAKGIRMEVQEYALKFYFDFELESQLEFDFDIELSLVKN